MNKEITSVTEEVTENTEAQTVEEHGEGIELTDTSTDNEAAETKEELPKRRYVTDEELNEIVDRRVARKMRKFEKETENTMSIYKDTENVLKSALRVEDMSEVNQKLREFYEEQGDVKLPEPYKPGLTSRQHEILARADAQEFIEDGYDSMLEEANRLAKIGYKNLNEEERIVFDVLAERLTIENDKKELQKLGAKDEILNDKSFIDFRKQFNSKVPIKNIFEMYQSTQPKKNIKALGSMKDTITKTDNEKDYYSPEDVKNLSRDDWNKPGVWEKVRASQRKWK